MKKETLAIASRIFVLLSNFGIVLLNLHFAGMEGQGIISMLNTGILLCATLSAFIGGGALIYLIPRKPSGRLLFPSVIGLLVAGGLTAIILWVIRAPVFLHAVALGMLQSAFIVHQMILLGKNRANPYQWMILAQGLLSLSLTALFYSISTDPGYSDYIKALYVSFTLTNVLGMLMTHKEWSSLTREHLREDSKILFHYGKFTQAGNIFHLTNQRSYLFFLEKSTGEGALLAGIFSVVLYLGEGLWSVAKSLSAIQGAAISQNENHLEHRSLTKTYLRISILASFVGAVVIALLPPTWLNVIMDGSGQEVRTAFLFFIPGILFNTATVIFAHYFSGKGYHRYNALSSLSAFLCSMALGPLFIFNWGVPGAAGALSIALAVQFFVQGFLYRKTIRSFS